MRSAVRRHATRLAPLLGLLVAALAPSACVESNRGVLEVNPNADSLIVVSGNAQSALTGYPVLAPPTVVVKDQRGFRVPGVRVTFTPGQTSGTVENRVVLTDSAGRATPGTWTVGPDSGVDTLYASVIGPPTAKQTKVLFTASVADPCTFISPYTIGATITDSVPAQGCGGFTGGIVKPYRFTLAAPATVKFTGTSTGYVGGIELVRRDSASSRIVAISVPDSTQADYNTFTTVLAAGKYDIRVGSTTPTGRGRYSLTSTVGTLPDVCTQNVFVTRGAFFTSQLGSTDCTLNLQLSVFNGPSAGDYYAIYIGTNETITVRMASIAFDAVLLLVSNQGTLIGFSDNSEATGTNAGFSFTPTTNGYTGGLFYIVATSKGALGAYTLTIDP